VELERLVHVALAAGAHGLVELLELQKSEVASLGIHVLSPAGAVAWVDVCQKRRFVDATTFAEAGSFTFRDAVPEARGVASQARSRARSGRWTERSAGRDLTESAQSGRTARAAWMSSWWRSCATWWISIGNMSENLLPIRDPPTYSRANTEVSEQAGCTHDNREDARVAAPCALSLARTLLVFVGPEGNIAARPPRHVL
jgi:hypothetical protein